MNSQLLRTHRHWLALRLCLALSAGMIWGSTLGQMRGRAIHFEAAHQTSLPRTPAQPGATSIATALTPAAPAQAGGAYNLVKSVMAGGGERSTGGTFQLNGTLGQSLIGEASGGQYSLSGGFWAGGDNYQAVSSLNPTSGAVGATATITGANFTGVSAVRLANNGSAQFTINSSTQITATVPRGRRESLVRLPYQEFTDDLNSRTRSDAGAGPVR